MGATPATYGHSPVVVPLYTAPHPPSSPYPFSNLPNPYSQVVSSNEFHSPPTVSATAPSRQLFDGLLLNPKIDLSVTSHTSNESSSVYDKYDDSLEKGEDDKGGVRSFDVRPQTSLEYSDSSDIDDLATCVDTFHISNDASAEPKDEEPLYSDPLEIFDYDDSVYHVYVTTDGYTYYLDMSSGHSQWDDPR
jgi:hypothetical protein